MRLETEFHFPDQTELAAVYDRFLKGDELDEKFFVTTSEWVRVDPRLGEIWCSHFVSEFSRFNPNLFRSFLVRLAFPQVVGVLVEQVIRYYDLPKAARAEMRNFLRFVMNGVPPVTYQNFFIGLSPLGAKSVCAVSEFPTVSFARYGFYERTVFRNKGAKRKATDLGKGVREQLLDEFLKLQDGRFTVEDYLKSLPASSSRRVAQLDLAGHRKVRAYGETRSRYYRFKR